MFSRKTLQYTKTQGTFATLAPPSHGYIITANGKLKPTLKNRNNFAVFLGALAVLLVLLGMGTWLLRHGSDDKGSSRPDQTGTGAPPQRTLAESPRARFLSIFVSDPAGGLASYLVGGGTEEFNGFASAIAGAQAVEGAGDESFSDLLVLSFGANDTLEVSYSRSRNQFIIDDRLYRPTDDLAPMIGAVEQRFQNQ